MTRLTCYVRSSVLGGRVVTELNRYGQKQKGYVYLGGEVIAEQGASTSAFAFRHDDPVVGSRRSYGDGAATEPDPAGVDAGLSVSSVYIPPDDPIPGNKDDLVGGCTMDGGYAPCSLVMKRVNAGVAAGCPGNDCGARVQTLTARDFDGRVVGSFSRIVVQGQAGWDGSLDGTYRRDVRGDGTSLGFGSSRFSRVSGGFRASYTEIASLGGWLPGPQNNDPRVAFRDRAVYLSNNPTMTDCQKLVELIVDAGRVGDDPIGTLMTGLTEIGNRFGGASDPQYRVGVLKSDPHYEKSFGQTGFNGSYKGGGFINKAQPNDNQVRHFVGWLAAGYYHNGLTTIFAEQMLYRSEGGDRSINNPDVALGLAAIKLGANFNGDSRKLAQDVWNQICGESSKLNF